MRNILLSGREEKEHLQEKCGVIGILSADPKKLHAMTIATLPTIEHRGADGTGCVNIGVETARFTSFLKASEFARRLQEKEPRESKIALLHTRYATTGEATKTEELQPFLRNTQYGKIGLAFNGNIWNWNVLKQQARQEGYRLPNQEELPITESTDTEAFFYLLSKSTATTLEDALQKDVFPHLKGAYSLLIAQEGTVERKTRLLVIRDPIGIHPLWVGITPEGDIIAASETGSLDALSIPHANFTEVLNGTMLIFEEGNRKPIDIRTFGPPQQQKLCALEALYFMRFDALLCMNGCHPTIKRHINMFRKRVGQLVGKRVLQQFRQIGMDHLDHLDVIPIPDSGLPFGRGIHDALKTAGANLNLEAVVLNPDQEKKRSFISPNARTQKHIAIQKRKYIRDALQPGKDVLLCDDSMIRGNTLTKLIDDIRPYINNPREHIQGKVHVVLSLPPFVDICHYGIAIKKIDELATRNSHAISPHNLQEVDREQLKTLLGLRPEELLIFATHEEIRQVLREDLMLCNIDPSHSDFCFGCMGEPYPDNAPHTPV
jgi:amidophosphoribosyltransferase